MPKILLNSTPQRAVLRAPQQVVEQLVDVPKPVINKDELLDAYHDAEGRPRFSLVGTRTRAWVPLTGRMLILAKNVVRHDDGGQRTCDHAARVPAIQVVREHGDAPVSVLRQSG